MAGDLPFAVELVLLGDVFYRVASVGFIDGALLCVLRLAFGKYCSCQHTRGFSLNCVLGRRCPAVL